MSAHGTARDTKGPPHRRGACPGLSAPMATGDGLLVRLLPIGTIPLAAFAALCRAARTHGNGIVEVTSRGSIQVRGLSAASAARFASEIAALRIAAADGIPVLINPLAGLEAEEIFDATSLAAELRAALAEKALATRLAAKISIAIDGGGALNLDAVRADIRLAAQSIGGNVALRVTVGADAADGTTLGHVPVSDGVTAAIRLLEVLAQRSRNTLARDVLATTGVAPFHQAVADLLLVSARSRQEELPRSAEPIGLHRLRDGSLACGLGLAFGHADAGALQDLAEAAAAAGASGLRAAPYRALLAIGLTDDAAMSFAAAAERLGFIVRRDDPRRHVVACAGAPICASAHIAARALAPAIAERVAPHLDEAFTVHISGCAKGCARAAPATLTIVGTPEGCALIADGSARDTPFASVSTEELPAAIARYARTPKREVHYG
jgi:precorrin-3B synthase